MVVWCVYWHSILGYNDVGRVIQDGELMADKDALERDPLACMFCGGMAGDVYWGGCRTLVRLSKGLCP